MTTREHFEHIGDITKRIVESLEKLAQVDGGIKNENSIRSPLVRPPGVTFTTQHTDEQTQWAGNCIENFKSRSS